MDTTERTVLGLFRRSRHYEEETLRLLQRDLLEYRHRKHPRQHHCRELERQIAELTDRIARYRQAEQALLKGDIRLAVEILDYVIERVEIRQQPELRRLRDQLAVPVAV